jgi:hypothetical protein
VNAVERLEAAIAKLEVLREAARGGPWSAWHSESPDGNSAVEAPTHDEDNPWLVVAGEAPDVDLIVTLHRTIEPQLAILRTAAASHHEWRIDSALGAHVDAYAIADAILGGV